MPSGEHVNLCPRICTMGTEACSYWTELYCMHACVLSCFSRGQLSVILWIVCSLLGSSVHEILQARILEWVAMPSLIYITCMSSHFSHVRLYATLGTVACPAPLSLGFSRQEYWSGLPCSPPGDLAHPGIELVPFSISCIGRGFSTTSTTWEAPYIAYSSLSQLLLPVNKIICVASAITFLGEDWAEDTYFGVVGMWRMFKPVVLELPRSVHRGERGGPGLSVTVLQY